MENKQMILIRLRDALQWTSGGSNVSRLEHRTTKSGDEEVIIHFRSGYTKTIDVTADSGIAIMKDVLRAL